MSPGTGLTTKLCWRRCPISSLRLASRKAEKYATYYQVFVGQRALFEKGQKVNFADVTDGTSNTLMVVEAETPVPWTKPEDLSYMPGQPLPKLGGQFKDGFVALTADGAIRFIKRSIDPKTLNAMITRNGVRGHQ